jgi:hypothetical protein
MQEHDDQTHEGEALGGEALPVDPEAVGDPAAAGVDAEGAAPGTAEVEAPGAAGVAPYPTTEPLAGDPAGIAGEAEGGWQPPGEQSPAAADQRGAEQAESPPFIPIAGAFVGAFVAAKLLGKLTGGDD